MASNRRAGCVADGATHLYGPGPGFVIPDNDPVGASSSIVIDHSGTVQDLDLILGGINHTWLGDLIIVLTHENSATSWLITNRAGQLEGGSETFGFDIDLDGSYTIDDESTSGSFHDQINFEGGILPAGDYNSLGSLANFDGLNIAGTWTLSISDRAPGDTGVLQNWSLLAQTQPDTGLVFAFEETANGVTGTLSGSLDLANSVAGDTSGVSAIGARINPPFPFISTGSNPSGARVDSYLLWSARPFGPGEASFDTLTFATSASGDFFSLTRDIIPAGSGPFVDFPALLLPDGYVSGTSLSATMFFEDATFDSLGITPGTYVYGLLQEPANVQPPEGSSVCASGLAPEKVITVTFGQAPVAPFEDCIFSSGFEP
ncbi:MAG: proprotein convertase P-domain-containing protein [Wenzhouxiangella sp.]|jgi:subtilisin-like proprotein convertase family protein|nr:proprotein convertase P-domain-containing protein [Wenzhouxiangella sp.]